MKQLTKNTVHDIINARWRAGDFCDEGSEAALAFLKSCGRVITAGDIARAHAADIAVFKLFVWLDSDIVISGTRFEVEYACKLVANIDEVTLLVKETVHGGDFFLSDGNVQMTLARGARLCVKSQGGSLTVNGRAMLNKAHGKFTVVDDGGVICVL